MGRRSKYIEETFPFTKKIPQSQKAAVEKLVDDYLKPFEVGYVQEIKLHKLESNENKTSDINLLTSQSAGGK